MKSVLARGVFKLPGIGFKLCPNLSEGTEKGLETSMVLEPLQFK